MAALKKMVAAQVAPPGGTNKKDYFFKSNPLLYANIAADVGIAAAPVVSGPGTNIVPHRVEDLLLGGVLFRVAVTTGTTPTNRKTTRLLCSAEKINTVEYSLIGKVIPQGTITSVSADLRAEDYLA